MLSRDISRADIAKIYDDLQRQLPTRTAALTVEVKMKRPGLKDPGVRREVVARMLPSAPQEYRLLRNVLAEPRPEPARCSPLEQIKGLTHKLDPWYERTGGNFGARF